MSRQQPDATAPDAAASDTTATAEVQGALAEAWDKVEGWARDLVESLPNVVAAVVVLLAFWLLGMAARRLVRRLVPRFGGTPELARIAAGAATLLVLGLGLVLALGVLNLDKTVTSLLAGAGILGLALGFAFQDIAENFMAGVILNVRHQFTEGDIIETNDYMGVVERVQLRATVLRTFPGQRVLIPNAEVFKNPIINYSQPGVRRVDVVVGVAYGDDLEKARRVAMAAVEGIQARDRSREVELYYQGFGDSSIDFQLRFWIPFRTQTEYLAARSEAILRIKKAFDENGITIPFPIRTLDFGVVGGEPLARHLADVRPRGTAGG